MRSRIGVTKGLELAHGLAGAIRDFSARDQKAAKERRTKIFAAKRAFERESEEEKEELRASLVNKEKKLGESKKHAESRHAARVEWIERALPARQTSIVEACRGSSGKDCL